MQYFLLKMLFERFITNFVNTLSEQIKFLGL